MIRSILLLILGLVLTMNCFADRIYILNSSGYNTAEPQLINAITNNGHTVNSNFAATLPVGFTSTCVDPVNGYDWLCFFGNSNFSGLSTQIKTFIDAGGKVFYQYEVSCCTQSASSVATILSNLTGLPITPNSNSHVAFNGGNAAYTATINCCITFTGGAYKGLDGLPFDNQLQATETLPGATPPITACLNFGCKFATTDFTGTANKGAFIGLGDLNIWYDSDEPFNNAGSTPINLAVVDYFFPNNTSTCYAFPPGCIDENVVINPTTDVDLGSDATLCEGDTLLLDASNVAGTYLWQDNSTQSTFNVTQAGTYWVEVTSPDCFIVDTITVSYVATPTIDLGNDTALCVVESILLDATTNNSTYLWQDNSTNPTFTVTTSGSYWVEVNNVCGNASDTIQIDLNPAPFVNLGADVLICSGDSIVLNATNMNASYLWQDNSTEPIYVVHVAGTYSVTASVGNCETSDMIVITEDNCEVHLEIPNVFTPNNDGANDLFLPLSSNGIITMNTIIYNRWGIQVFETDNLLIGWDGLGVKDGVYFWVVRYTDMNGESEKRNGFVTVER